MHPPGESLVLMRGQHHQIRRRCRQMMNDSLFGIGGQGAHLPDPDAQFGHIALGAGFRQQSPLSQGRANTGEVFESLRRDGRVHMHDRQLGTKHQRQLECMGEGHLAVLRKICGVEDPMNRERGVQRIHVDVELQ
jgi:hypothetical protein